MTATHHVHLAKERIVFSAAHFITFNHNVCERLHGHNYQVYADVFDELDGNHYVIDFIALRDELAAIADELDHHMLLPAYHPQILVTESAREVEAVYEDRRWVFPKEDCIILPVANTTTELLAHYIGKRLLDALQNRLGKRPTHIRIGVDENGGQWAVCELIDE